jgi:RNA 3'-terminal phosphate cyclase (ATP)
MITLDGSHGEGGGQILRSSLALSIITGKPFRIENIRANREKPGLQRQHLTAVLAAAEISSAQVTGAELHSRTLEFYPGPVKPGDYRFAIGTAGSTTLVFQTVLPPLMLASGESRLTLEGGTHNEHAPPFEFIEQTFLPLINKMGPRIDVQLERPGFYPAGGGRWTATIRPATTLRPLELLTRGEIRSRTVTAVVSELPLSIAQRELSVLARRLNWPADCFHTRQTACSSCAGNYITIAIASDHLTEIVSSIGRKGIRSEAVSENAAREAQRYVTADVPVGEHLADQLLMPLALAGSGAFRTLPVSPHTHTNINVLAKFLPARIVTPNLPDGGAEIRIG